MGVRPLAPQTAASTVTAKQSTASDLKEQVQGETAHDAAATGNPVRIGAKAATSLPAAVADGDAVNAIADKHGRQIATLDAPPDAVSQFNPAAVTDNTAHDCLGLSGAGLKWYLDWLIITNSHATVGTLVTIQDDTAVTPIVLAQGWAEKAGGGFAIPFPKGSPCGGANQKLQVICGTTGANVYVSGAAHKAP